MATSPSERDFLIAAYQRTGRTLRQTAEEFHLAPESVRRILGKLDRVLRAADKLEEDPTDLEALADFGKLSQRVCSVLRHNGVRSVDALGSLTRRDLALLVGVGPKGRREIIDLARRWGIEFPPKQRAVAPLATAFAMRQDGGRRAYPSRGARLSHHLVPLRRGFFTL